MDSMLPSIRSRSALAALQSNLTANWKNTGSLRLYSTGCLAVGLEDQLLFLTTDRQEVAEVREVQLMKDGLQSSVHNERTGCSESSTTAEHWLSYMKMS